MNAFRPIYRELAILFLRWARHDLRLQPGHPDLPFVIMRQNDLEAERPHQLKTRAPCCSHNCEEGKLCPLRNIHHGDGGFRVDGSQSLRLHPEEPSDRVLIGAVGAGVIVLVAACMQALGIPVSLLF